jgi:hypothetical protein
VTARNPELPTREINPDKPDKGAAGSLEGDRQTMPQTPACDRCSQGVMDEANPHMWGECDCACHGIACDRCGATDCTWKSEAACSRCWGSRQHYGQHRLKITARRFSRLRWPTVTTIWRKVSECGDAESYAQTLRDLGARVVVDHQDHRPMYAPEVDPS